MSIGCGICFRHKVIVAVAVAAVGLCSCSSGRPDVAASFVTVDIGRDAALAPDEGSPRCEVAISVHAACGEGKAARLINGTIAQRLFLTDSTSVAVRRAAEAFADDYVKHYTESLRSLYAADRAYADRQSWYEYAFSLHTDVGNGRDSIAVYVAETRACEGGEPEVFWKQAMNFDMSTGHLLTPDDVFVPGYTSRLNDILLAALMQKTGAGSLEDLHAKGYLQSTDIFVPDNYVIGADAITFIYNVYEIAPLSEGIIELTLDYSDINDLLPK